MWRVPNYSPVNPVGGILHTADDTTGIALHSHRAGLKGEDQGRSTSTHQ